MTFIAAAWIFFGKKFELSFTYGTARDGDDRHDVTGDLPRERGGSSFIEPGITGGHAGAPLGQ